MSIPECIFHKIMLYNTHPVADVFKSEYNHMYDDVDEMSFYEVWLTNFSNRAKQNYLNWLNQPPINSDNESDDEGVHYFR